MKFFSLFPFLHVLVRSMNSCTWCLARNIYKKQPIRRYHINGYIPLLYSGNSKLDTVESPVWNQPKCACKSLVVAYGRWSLRRNEPQGGIFPRRHHTLWKTGWDNLLHAVSKFHYV